MRRILFLLLIGLMIAGGTLPAIAYRSPENTTQTAVVDDLVNANSQFAFDLYAVLSEAEEIENLIFSPYSISMALAMVYAGAKEDTATQMAQTLHFDEVGDTLDADFFDLQTALNAEVEASYGHPSELNIVNGMWAHFDFPFRQDYMNRVQTMYQAEPTTVDFESNLSEAVDLINEWISENTNERIQNMLDPGAIPDDMRLILVNAIFFKGTWLTGFPRSATEDGPFTLLDGSTVMVPMMHQMSGSHGYLAGENYTVVEMHFQDSYLQDPPYEMAMMFILPDEGAFADVETSLDVTWFEETRTQINYTYVDIVMPKFSHQSDLDLIETLQQLGMIDAFDQKRADFSGIFDDDEKRMFISMLLHRANIDVDEAGTEASAVTVVGASETQSLPPDGIDVVFDQPYIYAIYDRVSGSILFLGRVMNPES